MGEDRENAIKRVLQRQLKKSNITDFDNIDSKTFKKFIEMVEHSYLEMANDRYILERSLDISSKEMNELNDNLEQSVREKTKELEELNRCLEERVEAEIQKNFEQQQAMVQQSRLAQMGEMISMIAHQWRQPLTAISSVATALSLKVMLDSYDKNNFEKELENIIDYSQHLSSTIDDFREFFKKSKIKKETSLESIIETTLGIVGATIETKGIKIVKNYNCNQNFETYSNEVKQVVLNLLKNSEEAIMENSVKNPTIILHTYKNKNYCYLDIIDNGGGIKKEVIKKIFMPYFTTKEKTDGTGLGLYMSKTIIDDHCAGKLSVYTKNNETTMQIKLPL